MSSAPLATTATATKTGPKATLSSTSFPVESLQNRLSTGLGNPGGARGSLTRCIGRFSGLKRSLLAAASATASATETCTPENENETVSGTSKIPQIVDNMSRELKLARVELTKLYFVAQRQEEELEDIQEFSDNTTTTTTTNSINDTSKLTVQKLRHQLRQAKQTVASKTEYEQTAKQLVQSHDTPVAVLQEQIDSLQKQLQQANGQLKSSQLEMRTRRKQFQAFLQCLMDIKKTQPFTTSSPLPFQEHTKESEQQSQPQAGSTVAAAAAGDVQKDKKGEDKDDDDEEGALYDDL